MFSIMPVSRMTRNITRIANSDGIIAISRAVPLRKTTRKAPKMIATVSRKLSTSVGTRFCAILAFSGARPTVSQRELLERRMLRRPSRAQMRRTEASSRRKPGSSTTCEITVTCVCASSCGCTKRCSIGSCGTSPSSSPADLLDRAPDPVGQPSPSPLR